MRKTWKPHHPWQVVHAGIAAQQRDEPFLRDCEEIEREVLDQKIQMPARLAGLHDNMRHQAHLGERALGHVEGDAVQIDMERPHTRHVVCLASPTITLVDHHENAGTLAVYRGEPTAVLA